MILPPQHLHVLNRSETEVAAWDVSLDIIQPRYTMARDKALSEDTIRAGFGVVWKHLTRPKDVARFHAMIDEELTAAFDDYLGILSTGWEAVKVFPLCVKIVARAANRTYYGLPVCA